MKRWTISEIDKPLARSLADECGIPPFTALLLTARGIADPAEAEEFLSKEPVFEDPYGFADMETASARIRAAIDAGEKIAVYGDYDADGITASALLYLSLRKLGADVRVVLPHREGEGYGMNKGVIENIKADGISLIVTVDNGISAAEEIGYATSLGIEVVVTDHHIPPESGLPAAVAVVDPKRADCLSEFKGYAGVGVAFMLACALENAAPEELTEDYADLVAIGTIADIMPLLGDNRRLVTAGLAAINRGTRIGVRALCKAAGISDKEILASQVAFMLAPRLNAAGRIGEPEDALNLLLCESETEAANIAERLCEINAERQKTESDIVKEAKEMILADESLLKQRVLVVAGENWPKGIIGIAAARLCETYGKPAIVFSINGDEACGSARSYKGVSIYELIASASGAAVKFGGHETAAGVTVETLRLDEFRGLINQKAKEIYPVMPFAELRFDCKLSMKGLCCNTVYAQKALEPFGSANPAPLYCLTSMTLKRITPVGDGKHLRLTFAKGDEETTVMRFGTDLEHFGYLPGDVCDLAVGLDVRPYNGSESLSVVLKDIRPAEINQDELFDEIRAYEAYLRGEGPLAITAPLRSRVEEIYKKLRAMKGFFGTGDLLCRRIGGGYAEIMTILAAFDELGLIVFKPTGDQFSISLCKIDGKVDLAASSILNALKREGA